MLKKGDFLKGKYKIIKPIGAGGTSYVYLAMETKTGKFWAVKEIPKNNNIYKATVNPDGTLTEVEIVKELNHPLLPKVNDVYEDDESIVVVMEYVNGKDLDYVLGAIDNHRLDEDDVIRFGKDLCEILMYLHTRENPIIYKDLKPANVMINQEGDIRLIDFGIAQYLNAGKARKTNKIGTNGFASPEHTKKDIDQRADIFTLGRTLYMMAAGTIPSKTEDYVSRDGQSKVRTVYTPKPFSELGIDISKDLERIIFKCMEKDKEKRYQTTTDVMVDLMKLNSPSPMRKNKKKSKKKLSVDGAVSPRTFVLIASSLGLIFLMLAIVKGVVSPDAAPTFEP